MILQQIISQSQTNNFDIENINLIIEGGVQTTIISFLWFNAYRASDFPMITCDKNYFFIYGTDHSTSGGGIYWGKGDNVDGSDFMEIGRIISGHQAETPYLIRVDDKAYLFYHTISSDPANTIGIQATRLRSMTSGELHTAIWTDEGLPLGFESGETHLGYCKVYPHPIYSYIAIHLSKGGVNAEYKFSKGINITDLSERIGVVDIQSHMPIYRKLKATYGTYFKLHGKNWFIGTIEFLISEVGDLDKNCIVAETDENLNITRLIKVLNNGENTRNYDAYIENQTAHIYFQNPSNKIYYASLDLSHLE